MAKFTTITDVIRYALFRAGEFTGGALQDGDFYNGTDGGPVLGYINDVMEGLLLGSPLGLTDDLGRPMPAVDWWWARKHPAGILHLAAPISLGTVTATKGSPTITFSTPLVAGTAIVGTFIVGTGIVGGNVDIAGYRIRIGSSIYLPRVTSIDSDGLTAELDEPWPDETMTASTYTAFKVEYDLASDFLRFTTEPTLSSDPWSFEVLDEGVMNRSFPVALTQAGQRPLQAALIAPQKIRLSSYSLDLNRVEYPYIGLPTSFVIPDTSPAQNLILPPHYRRALGLGAAYYIAYDKADNKAGDLMSEFRGMYRAMVSEHNRHQRKMSQASGRINYRLGQVRGFPGQGPLRTTTGLIIGP